MSPLDVAAIRASWRYWLWRESAPAGPRWLLWIWPFVYAAVVAVPFWILSLSLSAASGERWHGIADVAALYGDNYVVSLCITFAIMGCFHVVVATVGRPRIQAMTDGRRALLFGAASFAGVAVGLPIGYALLGGSLQALMRMSTPSLVASIAMTVLGCWLFSLYFSLKRQQMRAQMQAQEARLRLLQGQMEPHFLFNTLANVICMIDTDARGAQRLLETLTDYLRASLGGLRDGDSTVAAELELAGRYLQLMQARMGDRLHVEIDADPALHGAALPPLLLQPLVENAVKHGLEPSLEGGRVRLTVRRLPGDGRARMQVCIDDDGVGLQFPRGAAGNGVALANLRERLRTRFGEQARFELAPRPGGGTRACLDLPVLSIPSTV
jgi:hypothetical protein